MTALYLIAQEYRAAAAQLANLDLDPQTLADTLESISGDLEAKAQSYGFVIRGLNAEADAIDEWAKQAKEHAAAKRARAELVKQRLSEQLHACGITRIEGPGITLSFRKTSAVVIDDEAQIPAAYMRQKPPPAPEPDKVLLAAAMKAGETVPGARMLERQALQVKA